MRFADLMKSREAREREARLAAEAEERERAREALGKRILEDRDLRGFVCGLMIDMGYFGGWPGKADDFNQGLLEASKMIKARVGKGNLAALMDALAEEAKGRIAAGGQ